MYQQAFNVHIEQFQVLLKFYASQTQTFIMPIKYYTLSHNSQEKRKAHFKEKL